MSTYGVYVPRDVPLDEAGPFLDRSPFDYAAVGEHVSFYTPTAQSIVGLSYLAGVTRRIELLSSVLLAPLYPPGLLAKMVAELALYSRGRFQLGIGVGGENAAEFAACGVPVPERDARTDECLQIVARLLREETVSHEGSFWQFESISIAPRPEQAPPIWVGGRRPRARARAGRFGDVWLPYFSTPQHCRESYAEVRQHAVAAGRSPDAVTSGVFVFVCVDAVPGKAVQTAGELMAALYGTDMRSAVARYVITGTATECAERLRDYAAAGVERFVFSTLAATAEGHLRMWEVLGADVLPLLG